MSGSIDRFAAFRQITSARVGLGRVGDSLPTAAVLDLREAHARARDAIHRKVDFEALGRQLGEFEPLSVRSRAPDRRSYLARPDWGRRLDEDSAKRLAAAGHFPLVVVVADGLSASAVDARAAALVRALDRQLGFRGTGRVVFAEQARVALGDEIAVLLGAETVVVLIGERPGLSCADSLGIYLTHRPRIDSTDAERNCISNVHAGGLGVEDAAREVAALRGAALALGRSGVDLKLEAVAKPLGTAR